MEFDIRIGSIKTRLHLSQSENQIKKFPTLELTTIKLGTLFTNYKVWKLNATNHSKFMLMIILMTT